MADTQIDPYSMLRRIMSSPLPAAETLPDAATPAASPISPQIGSYIQSLQNFPSAEQYRSNIPTWRRVMGGVATAGGRPDIASEYFQGPYNRALQDWMMRTKGLETAAELPSEIGERQARSEYYRSRGPVEMMRMQAEIDRANAEEERAKATASAAKQRYINIPDVGVFDAETQQFIQPKGGITPKAFETFQLERPYKEADLAERRKEHLEDLAQRRSESAAKTAESELEKEYKSGIDEITKPQIAMDEFTGRISNLKATLDMNNAATDPLVAPDLFLTMTRGTSGDRAQGVRLTMPEITNVQGGMTKPEAFNRWLESFNLSGGPYLVTPEQRAAYKRLTTIVDSKLKLRAKALSDARKALDDATDKKEVRKIRRELRDRLIEINETDVKVPIPMPPRNRTGVKFSATK